ncbi:uncharacterized protein B0H64DRAFT_452552 [Chaetomium fimeti]|uniref:Rhodopsin domain-containing protein n=1 Tax=Chaetomium fimeti TaxID=1854472 RepID=A0AAE0H607_9PEZI|nr:hypothetical protein B0H64DRAFT_452552 [Chaetomium fimeti]
MADSVLPGIPGYDPHNLQPWTVEVVASVTVLAVVSVALRLYYLGCQHLTAGDNTTDSNPGQLWNFVVVGFIFAMHSAGMGIHADHVSMDNLVLVAKFLVVAEILYIFNLVWTKIAILLMYYRIFHFAYFKKMAYGIGGFVVAWCITCTFLFIFICVPVEKLWYPDLPGHCIDQVGTWIANAASTILTDVVILILPIPQVWKLQLRRPEKIGVTIAFCLGFFVVFASAYRFSVLFSYTNDDPSYSLAPTVGWTAIEMSAGIVSACLPTLGPVMTFFAGKVGIKRTILTSRAGATTGASSRNFPKSTTPSLSDRTEVELHKSTKKDNGTFYRLPDDQTSGNTTRGVDAELRPEHGYGYTVTSRPAGPKADGASLSGDEVPLHGIRVHKDFKQVGA